MSAILVEATLFPEQRALPRLPGYPVTSAEFPFPDPSLSFHHTSALASAHDCLSPPLTAYTLPPTTTTSLRKKLMKALLTFLALVITLSCGSANAAGCLKGAAVGAVAGHVAGHHAVLGAIGGCVVGRHLAKEKAAKQKAAEQNNAAPSQ